MSRLLLASGLLLPLLALFAGVVTAGEGPQRPNDPHIGYVVPAGGQQGTVTRIVVGGQNLRGVKGVHLTGTGVTGRVVLWIPPFRPLDREESIELRRRLVEARDRRLAEAAGRTASKPPAPAPAGEDGGKDGEAKPRAKLPDHPLLENLDAKSLQELKEIAAFFFRRRDPTQQKRAIAETVWIDLDVAGDAEPGERELRLVTPQGLSDPLRVRVGLVPETTEQEPNDATPPAKDAADLPIVFNGQILPRDVDRFRFHAKRGQHLVARAEARRLVPYQADSVPGWMQATITLEDVSGHELAYGDDYRFDPDPVVFYDVERDEDVVLVVKDALARGREDFVYRVTVGELPFVTSVFPLGGRADVATVAEVSGVNLDLRRVPLDTRAGPLALRRASWRLGPAMSNPVPFAVGDLPEIVETEDAEAPGPTPITLPLVVNGRIDRPGDVDAYAFRGRAGQTIVASVAARALGSPLDGVLRLVADDGTVVAWNDDHPDPSLGEVTHQADPWLETRLPKTGTYRVVVTDGTAHGGPAYAYRLRVSPPRPDFDVLASPSSLDVPTGRATVVALHVVRRDGYDGPVDVTLDGAPPYLTLAGARIPAGRDRVLATLSTSASARTEPVTLHLVARATVDGREVAHAVTPADAQMQAFATWHLVEREVLVACVVGPGRGGAPITLEDPVPVRLVRGGTARVRVHVPGRPDLSEIRFVLYEPPAGVSLDAPTSARGELVLPIRVAKDGPAPGAEDNLIVEAFTEREVPGRDGRPAQTRRVSLGVLPAIPFQVVRR